jgi:N-acetylglucosamine kinase-like BadF-type ATPase
VQSSKRGWIGMDGGGSKTVAALCDEQGDVLARAQGDSANVMSRSWPEVERTLRELIDELLRQSGMAAEQVAAVCLGLAGADRPETKSLLQEAFGPLFGERLLIDNDAAVALYAGTWGEPGVVLIAGTGSIAYGMTKEGARHRVGGWGYLLGDEGSGFDLGRSALASVLRAHDGRGESTMLTELVLGHFGLRSPAELIQLVYGADNPRKLLAEASQVLLAAAEAGDALSLRLVEQAAAELVTLGLTCLKRVGERQPVVLAGGLLTADTLLRQRVIERLSAHAETRIPAHPPVVGALVMALRHTGIAIDQQVRDNLQKNWMGSGRG